MKKHSITDLLVLCFTLFISINISFSQISREGMPPSFSADNISLDYQQIDLPSPDQSVVDMADANLASSPGPYRIGKLIPLDVDIDNEGTWTDLPYGGRIWRLKIIVRDALATSLYYDRFWLPPNSELYLYNETRTHVIGAFTDFNNHENGLFATEIIEGESVTLEYYEPEGVTEDPVIHISDVASIFRGVSFTIMKEPEDRGGSLWCMINVNCPEGDDWQMEKKGVVRQYMVLPGGWVGWCSGSLINNTTWDLTPYVLTAHHCGEDCTPSQFNQWIFYFKYESATCTGSTGPSNFTTSGCSVKAEGDRYTGSDFALLKLNTTPPESHEPYWNGWNRSNIGSPSGVSIHHPAGDIKKISTYNSTLTSSQWNNNGVLSHWKCIWAATVNGTSIVEEGSSGSPLFDDEGRIVGDLTGGPGNQSCENTSYSLYGKVYWSWDQMGSSPDQQLKYWLDPVNTGEMYLPGTDGNDPICDFEADDPSVPVGGSVDFTDLSMGNPETWSWSFPGGTPSSSTEQDPEGIVYNNYGSYAVTLTISNQFGSDTETKTGYITVGDPPETDFNASATEIGVGHQVTFTDATLNNPNQWHWQFEGGTPSVSFNQNPAPIHYYQEGVFQVKLIATNDFGTDTEIKEDFITVYGAPVADFMADSTQVPLDYGVNFTDMTFGMIDEWQWTFEGGTPETSDEQNPQGITYSEPGLYAVTLSVSGPYGDHDTTKTDYIEVIAPPQAAFSCFDRYLVVGESAYIVDNSTGNPDEWSWVFEGGDPPTSDLPNPGPVQYNSEGSFDVSLTVANPYGNTYLLKEDYIVAGYAPIADFEADKTFIAAGESINYTDMSQEDPQIWNWTFEGGNPATSSQQDPQEIIYDEPGVYDVTLTASNSFGSDTKVWEDYITVGYVGTDEHQFSDNSISVYPNPTNGMLHVVFSGNTDHIQTVRLYNISGQKILELMGDEEIKRSLHFDLSHNQPGIYYLNIETDNDIIVKKITLTK